MSQQTETHVMTRPQEAAIRRLCDAYKVSFRPENYHPQFDLPPGYVAGWIGPIYCGISAEGEISS
jgi:hypothetical protein